MKSIKLLSIVFLSLISFSVSAYPMPIPFFLPSGGGGSISDNTLLALLIVSNIILFSCFFIRVVIFFLAKKSEDTTFFDYLIWDREYDYMFPIITSISFISINGIALFVYLVDKVSSFL